MLTNHNYQIQATSYSHTNTQAFKTHMSEHPKSKTKNEKLFDCLRMKRLLSRPPGGSGPHKKVIYWYERTRQVENQKRREEGTYKCKTNAVSKIKYLEQKNQIESEREMPYAFPEMM
jgi:hypothetical protein